MQIYTEHIDIFVDFLRRSREGEGAGTVDDCFANPKYVQTLARGLQRSAVFNIPLMIGVANSWANYLALPPKYTALILGFASLFSTLAEATKTPIIKTLADGPFRRTWAIERRTSELLT